MKEFYLVTVFKFLMKLLLLLWREDFIINGVSIVVSSAPAAPDRQSALTIGDPSLHPPDGLDSS